MYIYILSSTVLSQTHIRYLSQQDPQGNHGVELWLSSGPCVYIYMYIYNIMYVYIYIYMFTLGFL